ncbi:MAG: hypothetical protein ACHQZS_04300 [Candidatus Binatales bacterium]
MGAQVACRIQAGFLLGKTTPAASDVMRKAPRWRDSRHILYSPAAAHLRAYSKVRMQYRKMALERGEARADIVDGAPRGPYAAGWREIWRVDQQGYVYRTWEQIMPRIDDRILDCALYLYASEEDAQRGEHVGGTGFLVGISFGGDDLLHADNPMERTADRRHLYAITASHVAGGAPVVRLNTRDGNLYTQTPAEWIHHRSGDDVAIAPLDLDSRVHQFRFVGTNFFITEERWRTFRLGPGDETFMVGRFINRDETQSNMPVTRFGHIAGARPERLDQRPYRNVLQESILVEVHSVAGFSGSPVFVSVPFYRLKPLHDERAQRQFRRQVLQSAQEPWDHLLGVEWGVLDSALSVDASPAGIGGRGSCMETDRPVV